MKLSILGTNHSNQMIGCSEGSANEFKSYIISLVQLEKYDVIAEELSEDALRLWKCSDSVANLVAKKFQIKHVYCDPTKIERAELGIPTTEELKKSLKLVKEQNAEQPDKLDELTKSYWPAREKFWLQRLQALNINHALFILGSAHIHSFGKLLENESISFICICEEWKSV